MAFLLVNVLVLAIAALGSWWLSGYDSQVTGENETKDRIRRGIRCGISLLLVELAYWGLWRYWRYDDRAGGMLYLLTALPLAIIWCTCIGELFAQGFLWLIDPEDHRQFDSHKNRRDLDMLSWLIRNGQKAEAIQLCQMLKESGDFRNATLETILEHLGVKPDIVSTARPLAMAYQLRSQGKLNEAEALLNTLLVENPANVEAALILMRLYAENMRRADMAYEVLRSLEMQPYIAHAYIEFARRSIAEWSNPIPEMAAVQPQPESIEELVAHGYFGTVIEILDQKTKGQPQDFESWLKLAEIYGKRCGNIERAKQIIQQIESNSAFSQEQIQFAKNQLKEWRGASLHHAS